VGGDSKLAKGEDKVESLKFDQTVGHLKTIWGCTNVRETYIIEHISGKHISLNTGYLCETQGEGG